MHDCLYAIGTTFWRSVVPQTAIAVIAALLLLPPTPAHAVLLPEDLVPTPKEDQVEDDECPQAWPLDCSVGGDGDTGCGGWKVLKDLAQSEQLPNEGAATCSTGVRLGLAGREAEGKPVGAMFPGKVIYSQSGRARDGRDYGGVVVIKLELDDGSPQCYARYMFLDRRDLVKTGEDVKPGQRIGSIASSDMNITKDWWELEWGNMPAQVKIDIGCDEALSNLPMFMPREPFTGSGQEDQDSCPLTKLRFPAPPLKYLTSFESVEDLTCSVGARKDARFGLIPAAEQDNSEVELKVDGGYVEKVKPRGYIKRKAIATFSVFADVETRENLWGANHRRASGSMLFRDHTNYLQSTALRCANMRQIFSGKDGESITPEEVRELLTHCTNQYILGRSMFYQPYEQSDATADMMQRELPMHLREFLSEEELEQYEEWLETDSNDRREVQHLINKVFWRDLCQPLAMQPVVREDYKVNELLSKSWRELLVDWPEDKELEPIGRTPINRVDVNGYTAFPYERINDPSHPFSPRHIFAETDRERYQDYGVQCAATPVDLILGRFGDGVEKPLTVYGKRDTQFHQCIKCRIDLNETKKACFADPFSFDLRGGCEGPSGNGEGLCPNLAPELREALQIASQKYGLIPQLLEFILRRETNCGEGGVGPCQHQVGGGGGRGPWQIDISVRPAEVRDPDHEIIIEGRYNICDPQDSTDWAAKFLAGHAEAFDCSVAFVAGAYNAGRGGASQYWPNDIAGLNAHTTDNYVNDALQTLGTDNACLPGGPYPDGSGPVTAPSGGSGNNSGGFGPGPFNPGGGPSGPTGKPLGVDVIMAAAQFYGQPYSNDPGRDDPESGWADCSGLVAKALQVATGKSNIPPLSARVSTAIEKWAKANGGRSITKEVAMRTPGAFMTIGGEITGYDGIGPKGHIGLSNGDGTVIETGSAEGRKVGCSPFDWNKWTGFFLFPESIVDYDPTRNKPVEGLCDGMTVGSRGICDPDIKLPVNTTGKEDLPLPNRYYRPDKDPNWPVKPVQLPEPPSPGHHTKFDHEKDGMIYEGAWTECTDARLTEPARELCEELNKEEEEGGENGENGGPLSGGAGAFINPLPCNNDYGHYGMRPAIPSLCAQGKQRYCSAHMHTGLDISTGGNNPPIFAAADGTIIKAGVNGGYGNFTAIRHADGSITHYAHQNQICPEVKVGSTVVQGQVIGFVGTTGNSTGNHLHFEVKNPNFTDPLPLIPAHIAGSPQCSTINAYTCGQTVQGLPVGPGLSSGGKQMCVDRPCSLRYDEADEVSQCAWPKDSGGCGTLGNYSQRVDKDQTGDCCAHVTAPVVPLNILKMRPGYDEEALRPGAVDVEEFMDGGWRGERVKDGLPNGLKGEGGDVAPSDENPGAPEGYTFHEHFRDHRPYMRWWDTGAESGHILQNQSDAENPGGMYDALVGVGIEKSNCGIGGWGDPNLLDGNTSWMELKMYQARSQHMTGLRCISRHEKLFKRGQSEDYALRLAGGNYASRFTGRSAAGTVLVEWPLGWRGYASEPEQAYRFPYYISLFNNPEYSAAGGSVLMGLDQALPGDILIWDEQVSQKKRLPHVAYVTKAENVAMDAQGGESTELSKKRWHPTPAPFDRIDSITVMDYNFGKYPDSCGNTNWWGVGPERTLYKGRIPGTMQEIAERTEVTRRDCGNPDLTACIENFWDNVKIYRPYRDVRD